MIEKRDRLLELASKSADCALDALSRFLHRGFEPPSRACEWELRHVERLHQAPGREAVGLFADLDGAVGGRLGMLLDRASARALVAPLVHREPGPGREWLECSALLEASNVAFSAAAGALGDAIGVVIFPSVPRIWCESETGFAADLEGGGLEGLGGYAVFARVEGGAGPDICLLWLPSRTD